MRISHFAPFHNPEMSKCVVFRVVSIETHLAFPLLTADVWCRCFSQCFTSGIVFSLQDEARLFFFTFTVITIALPSVHLTLQSNKYSWRVFVAQSNQIK